MTLQRPPRRPPRRMFAWLRYLIGEPFAFALIAFAVAVCWALVSLLARIDE